MRVRVKVRHGIEDSTHAEGQQDTAWHSHEAGWSSSILGSVINVRSWPRVDAGQGLRAPVCSSSLTVNQSKREGMKG